MLIETWVYPTIFCACWIGIILLQLGYFEKRKQRKIQKQQKQYLQARVDRSRHLELEKRKQLPIPDKGYMRFRFDELLFLIFDYGLGFAFFSLGIFAFVMPIEITFSEYCLIIFVMFLARCMSMPMAMIASRAVVKRMGYTPRPNPQRGEDFRPILQWMLSILLTSLIYLCGLIYFIITNVQINLGLVIGLYLGVKFFVYLLCFFLSHAISKNALYSLFVLCFFAFAIFFTITTVVMGGILNGG